MGKILTIRTLLRETPKSARQFGRDAVHYCRLNAREGAVESRGDKVKSQG